MQSDGEQLHQRNQNRSTVVSRNGMVCASQPLATQAGIDVLRGGGNAIDAAICANAVLGVVEPQSCGIGGDLFAQIWIEKEKKLHGLNASGRSPYDWTRADAEALGLRQIPLFGPLSWSVPGCVCGWEAQLDKYGTRSLEQLLAPAIEYARAGFPVSPIIARSWGTVNPHDYPEWSKTFAPGGRAPHFGEIFTNEDLAEALSLIARDGAAGFYEGAIAECIVEFSERRGGRLSLRDFQDQTVDWTQPVTSSYRGYDVWELPPSGQGIAVLQMLNILESFDLSKLQPNSAAHLHLLVEAKKLVYEDRAAYYTDPDFEHVPVRELLSKAYAQERVAAIHPERASERVTAGDPRASGDTVYLCTADRHGNMVSLIQSIYHGFGSREVPDGLGFALQNRGAGFALDPAHPNRLEPHRRPFHTIIPAFVTQQGRPRFAFGVMGGDFQPQGQVQVLMNLIDFGMSVQQAGEQARVAHEGSSTPTGIVAADGGEVVCERGIDDTVRIQLEALGHRVRGSTDVFGGYQGVWRAEEPRRYFGGSDPRKDGCALGY